MVFTRLKDDKTLCEIYTNSSNLNVFSVGYIIAFDDEFYITKNLDAFGRQDGYFCGNIGEIVKISTDTNYLIDIKKLQNYHNQPKENLIDFSTDLLYRFLLTIKTNKRICSITLFNDLLPDITGYVVELDYDNIKVLNIDNRGHEDGLSIINLCDVSSAEFGSSEFVKLEILNSLT